MKKSNRCSLIAIALAASILLTPHLSACSDLGSMDNSVVSNSPYEIVYTHEQGVKGIDISQFNDYSDASLMDTIKSHDIKYVYIRIGFSYSSKEQKELGINIDKKVRDYVKFCEENNIPYGFYYCSNALSVEEGQREAQTVIKIIREIEEELGHPLEQCKLTFAIDAEYNDVDDRLCGNAEQFTTGLKAFIDTLVQSGIIEDKESFTIYTNLKGLGLSTNILKNMVYQPCFSLKELEYSGYMPKYGFWIAAYGEEQIERLKEYEKEHPNFNCFMLQTSNNGNTLDENSMNEEVYIMLVDGTSYKLS